MNTRLQQFISAENISQSQFADTIGVARASVSHILAGRNKPGFDFMESMARHFPALNLEWLITGKGKMYKSDSGTPAPSFGTQATASAASPASAAMFDSTEASPSRSFDDDLFSNVDNDGMSQRQQFAAVSAVAAPAVPTFQAPPVSQGYPAPQASPASAKHDTPQSTPALKPQMSVSGGRIQKIIVFYDNNTFQELK